MQYNLFNDFNNTFIIVNQALVNSSYNKILKLRNLNYSVQCVDPTLSGLTATLSITLARAGITTVILRGPLNPSTLWSCVHKMDIHSLAEL